MLKSIIKLQIICLYRVHLSILIFYMYNRVNKLIVLDIFPAVRYRSVYVSAVYVTLIYKLVLIHGQGYLSVWSGDPCF